VTVQTHSNPEDGGSMFFQNDCIYLIDYVLLQPTRPRPEGSLNVVPMRDRPALGCTQPPIQRVPGALSRG
jgi:hypothetical protein